MHLFKKGVAISIIVLLSGCTPPKPFTNFDFEHGDFKGWTIQGDAFTVTNEVHYDNGRRYYLPHNDYHVVGNKEKAGTLISPTFKISQSGYISFLISGGEDVTKTYVSVKTLKDKKEIKRISNDYYLAPFQTDTYVRFNVDLREYFGKSVYVEVVDESADSYLNFDDLRVSISEEELITLKDDTNIRLGISRSEDMREAANLYIKLNAWKINDEHRFNYHFMGQTGWINDPNGFSYAHNKINLFYQHNPYETVWGPMHWGHALSSDFVKWDYAPIALAPDRHYDSVGAFSGSAIEIDDKYYILYTGASTDGQVQALAVSEDGVTFEKYEANPVIGEHQLPPNATIADFRDPKVFKKDDNYYAIISARHTNNQYSSLLLYRSKDMFNWSYAGRTFSNNALVSDKLGIMLECPDYFNVDGQDIIIVSPQSVTNHRNSDGNVYIKGQMNWQTGVLENVDYETIEEIDHGFDFYAPQTMEMPDGRRIMIAWMAGWNRTPVTREFGYVGAMTFPRELSFKNNKLYQKPVEELKNYYKNRYKDEVIINDSFKEIPGLYGQSKHISVTFTPNDNIVNLLLFADNEQKGIKVTYKDGILTLDRSLLNYGYFPAEDKHNVIDMPVNLIEGKLSLEFLLDKYSLELFVNDGEKAATLTTMTNINNTKFLAKASNDTPLFIEGHDIIIS